MAHKWANWLRHPCRRGDPHRCRAGGKIRNGPQMGKVATSPLPSRGSPTLQSGGKNQKWAKWLRHPCRLGEHSGGGNQKWPTYGQSVNVTPAVSGIPTASERGGNQKWPTCGQSGYVTPAVSGIPTASERGGKSEVGKVATSPLPSWGSPPLQSGGGNQKWPTYGQSGYVTPAVSGIPTAAERGEEIRNGPQMGKVATSPLPSRGSPPLQSGGGNQKWAKWLRHHCRLRDPHRRRARGKIRSGPQVGKVATSPLPSRGSPPLQSRGGNQKWPASGQSGYVTGAKSEMAHLWAKWLRHPCRLGDPHRCRAGGKIRSGPQVGKMATSPLPSRGAEREEKSEVAHLWAKWLRHPCRLGDPHRFRAGGEIRSGPLVGKVATAPLPSRGSPPLQSGGQNQKWPTSGQNGYVTPAVSGIPTAAERGAKSEVAHKWAKWLRHPCRLGEQSGGQNQKWPTYGQSGYVTPAVSGIPTASERGGKSEVAHLWAKWLRHPCRLGVPHRCRVGGKIRSGPQVGKVATSPLPSRGAERGGKSEVAHKWAKWLRHPCRLGDPHRFRAGGKIRSGPLVGKVATPPLPSRGSPPLQSGGQNQKWPRSGQSGYVTPAVSGIPTASERGGGESEVAHLWAKWLRHPCQLGGPHRCRASVKVRVISFLLSFLLSQKKF